MQAMWSFLVDLLVEQPNLAGLSLRLEIQISWLSELEIPTKISSSAAPTSGHNHWKTTVRRDRSVMVQK